jgi:hypothetical protein
MVNLIQPHDYVVLFLIAAGFGALGGLAHMLITPVESTWQGFFGSTFVGAAAAVAIAYVFTPEVIVKAADGSETRHWMIVRVIPLSLIVGAGGKAVLSALQDRVLAAVKDAKQESTERLSGVATENAVRNVAASAVDTVTAKAQSPVVELVRAAAVSMPPDVHERLVNAFGPEGRAVLGSLYTQVAPEDHIQRLDKGLADARSEALKALEPEIEKQLEFVRKAVAAASGS